MSYRVDRFNGTFLVNVDDGTIDTTTDLRFIGKNYAGYGEVQNENFLHLLENFANTSPPPKAVLGQIWYDSINKKLKFYDGSQFKIASGALASATAPAGLTAGDFWFDTTTNQLFSYSGTEFVLIGPELTADLTSTAVVAAIVKDNLATPLNHNILKINVSDQTLAIISGDTFTLNGTLNPISGFSVIKKGLNLINTDSVTGVTNTDHYYWGTASNAVRFASRPISDFVLQSQLGVFGDTGFTVGDQSDLKIFIENNDIPVFENQLGGSNPAASLVFRIRTGAGAGDKRDVALINRDSLVPGTDNFFDLGTSVSRWKRTYSVDFYGNLTGNVTGTTTGQHFGNLRDQAGVLRFDYATGTFYGNFVGGTFTGNVVGDLTGTASNATSLNGLTVDVEATPNTIPLRDPSGNLKAVQFIGTADKANLLAHSGFYRATSINPDPNTIPVRDASGNIAAVVFNGTATSARYADLAEKYLSDNDYEIGTVMVIGGEKEITAGMWGQRAIGVISENPAFMMNRDLEGGVYVALKGRVPVKVTGSVRKGDRLIAANNGCAVAAVPHANDVFAIALETNDSQDIKLVEAVII